MKKLLLILLPLSFSVFALNNDLCIMGGWDQVNFKIKSVDNDDGYRITKGQKFDGVEYLKGNCIRIKADQKNGTRVMEWVNSMHQKINNGNPRSVPGDYFGAHVAAIDTELDGYTLPDKANFAFIGTMTLRKDSLRLTCPNVLIAQTRSYPGDINERYTIWFILYNETYYQNQEKPQINCTDDNGNLVKLKMASVGKMCRGKSLKRPPNENAADSEGLALKALSDEDTVQNPDDEEFSAKCKPPKGNEIKMTIVK